MALKLHKRGKIFHIRGAIRGITVRETTGCTRREDAEAILIRRQAEILERSIHGPQATVSFLEASVLYLEHGGEGRYIKPLVEHFGATKLSHIDQSAIDRAARIIYPNAAPSTRNRQVYTPVSAILHFAAERNLCEWRAVRRPKQPKGRIRWLEPEEAERLVEACSPPLQPLVTFLFYTGARLSEALYLDWQDVDLSRRQVWFTDTKNGEARGVPLHDRAFLALANLGHRDGAVFRRPGTKVKPLGAPYTPKSDGGGQIKTAFKGACQRAGIADFTPHDCRHTWATWHYAANRNTKALMELGGWKSEAMVMRYVHVNSDHLRESINALPVGTKSAQNDREAS